MPTATAERAAEETDELCSTSLGEPAQEGRLEKATAAHAVTSTRFYGWTMLPLAMLILVASSPGQTFGFAFFNPHFQEALSLSTTQLSSVYLIATLLAAVPLSYLGALTDRFGMRNSILATVVASSAGCLLLASANHVAVLCVCFFVMRLLGPGMMVLLANNTLAAWFDRRLGKATGAMQLSMAGAVAIVPAGMLRLIHLYGWRQAYVIIGCSVAALLLPVVWFFYRESPAEMGQRPDGSAADSDPGPQVLPGVPAGKVAPSISYSSAELTLREASRTAGYWVLIGATATWAMIGTGLVFHMEALFAERGIHATTMQLAPTMLALGMAVMQLLGGALADGVAIRWLLMFALSGIGASCLAVMVSSSGSGLLAAFTLYGFSQGLMSVIAGTAWARFFGRAHLGKIRGTAITSAVAASSVGPLVLGVSADYAGGFNAGLIVFIAAAGCLSVAGFWARQPVIRASRLESK
ncbi:MFS transporter [Adhaeretor mobilis]|nr:MFS transporter [Adhaeretor mobilis]